MKTDVSLRRNQQVLIKEHINLLDVKTPYLLVNGVYDWMTEEVIMDHFASITEEKVDTVVIVDGTTAEVAFNNPKGSYLLLVLSC